MLFEKSLNEVSIENIQLVIDNEVPESTYVEFKESIPCKKGAEPWSSKNQNISNYAQIELISEIISFANTRGGDLIIGLSETKNKPSRAKGINPIEACADFVDRFRNLCRDCIEPRIPNLTIHPILTGHENEGLVIITVPESYRAPHRLSINKECYYRREDHSEKMGMLDIQDLTLNVSRRLDMIEKRFVERHDNLYRKYHNHFSSTSVCTRISLIPTSDVNIDDVHDDNYHVKLMPFSVSRYDDKEEIIELPLYDIDGWFPILRGTRSREFSGSHLELIREINTFGLIEFIFTYTSSENHEFYFQSSWFMPLVANVLRYAELFRRSMKNPELEFGMEIEIYIQMSPVKFLLFNLSPQEQYKKLLLPEGSTVFPRYSVKSIDMFNSLVKQIQKDIYNLAGHSPDWRSLLSIDFSKSV